MALRKFLKDLTTTRQRKSILSLFFLLFLVTSCTRVPDQISPQIDYSVQDQYLQSLPSPFPPLSTEEKREPWGQEYTIGKGFAGQLDLYPAIQAFKRAGFLLPQEDKTHALELEYETLLCYYIGKKYEDVIHAFEHSPLRFTEPSSPICQDLLTILFDSYSKINEPAKAEQILRHTAQYFPKTAEKLSLFYSLQEGNLEAVESFSELPDYPYLSSLLSNYTAGKKSIRTAQLLNAFVPGAGYLYLGQKQSAVTAFLLNAAFIGTSYYFFHKGNIPAGIIFAGFETGWYFGGITGAGEEAKFYNERVYEIYATPLMNQHKLFPILSLRYAF